jgi:GMP synthase (glutamine-hydrolysing)
MRRIVVFKHVAQENLGTMRPLLAERGFRVRYVNFDRDPHAVPSLSRANGLVILGGWMGVYEADRYPHLKVEYRLIEEALARKVPVLGICLGAQILAHVLGANVRKHTEREAGWREVELTEEGRAEPLLAAFRPRETIFQMHGDTFDIPAGATHLARSGVCPAQAFRYGESAYGLQFHLEVNQDMIDRFLRVPANRQELVELNGAAVVDEMEKGTALHLPRSEFLSRETFGRFLGLFGSAGRSPLTRSAHGKPAL